MRRQTLAKLGLITGLSLTALFVLGPSKADASNPSTINFQGKVVNSDGTNVASGTYSFVFRLYDNSSPTIGANCNSNGQCWWEETQSSVTVTNGVFQVELGSACAFSGACSSTHSGIDFNANNSLYLTLKYNGDSSGSHNGFMYPVIHLTSVPYALNSDALGGLQAGNFVQLAQGLQTDSSVTNPSIFINKTGDAAGLLQLQRDGNDIFTIDSNGGIAFKADPSLGPFFQIQDSSSNALFSVDADGGSTTINGTSTGAILGSELVTNGTFTGSAAGWTLGSGWSYSSGQATHTPGSTATLSQNLGSIPSAKYKVEYYISSWTTGTVQASLDGVPEAVPVFGSNILDGPIIGYTTGGGVLDFTPSSDFDGTIDNVSVESIDVSNPLLSLQNNSTEFRADACGSVVFIGQGAGSYNSGTCTSSTAVGSGALYLNTVGSGNTAIGNSALLNNYSGFANSALGVSALGGNLIGNFNVAFGADALFSNSTGSNNVAIGSDSASLNFTGSNNTCIGYACNFSDALTNATAIGSNAQVTQSDSLVLGDNTTKVGIGTTAPSAVLDVKGDVLFQNITDSTTAFQVQDASAASVFNVDTSNARVGIGTYSYNPLATLDISEDNNSNTLSVVNTAPASAVGRYLGADIELIGDPSSTTSFSTTALAIGLTLQGTTNGSEDNAVQAFVNVSGGTHGVVTGLEVSPTFSGGSSTDIFEGLSIDGYSISGATVGTYYAIFSSAYKNVNITNPYNIYAAGDAPSHFEGAVTVGTITNDTNAFLVQNASAANVFNVDTATSDNLVFDGDFENTIVDDTQNWKAFGTSTIALSTTHQWQGNKSLQVTATTSSDQGTYRIYDFAPTTQYTLSFYAKVASGTISDFDVTWTDDNIIPTNCFTSQTLTTNWQRFVCTFITGGTVNGGSHFSFTRSGTSTETFYIDGVQLEIAGSASAFNAGGAIQIGGYVNSPLVIKNKQNSVDAFQIQNASGGNLLAVDTVGGKATVSNFLSVEDIDAISPNASNATCANAAIGQNNLLDSSSCFSLAVGDANTLNAFDTFAVGESNIVASVDSAALGGYNTIDSSGGQNISGGYNNQITDDAFESAIFGGSNTIGGTGGDNFIGGGNNVIGGTGYSTSLFGDSNTADGTGAVNFITGYNNQITGDSYESFVSGSSNYLEATGADNFISGYNNTVTDGIEVSSVFGGLNELSGDGTYNFVAGDNNNVQDASSSVALGSSNWVINGSLTGLALGNSNTIDNSGDSAAIGYNNTIQDAESSFALGSGNLLDGTTNSFAFGTGLTIESNDTFGFAVDNAGYDLNQANSFIIIGDSALALQVQNPSGFAVLTANTNDGRVELGSLNNLDGALTFFNGSNGNQVNLFAGVTSGTYSLILPTTGPSTSQCLQTDPTTASQLIFDSCSGAGGGDNIFVNTVAASNADFTNVTSTSTVAGITWSNGGGSPNQLSVNVSNADATHAGAVTSGTQTIGGLKTFDNGLTVTAGQNLTVNSDVFTDLTGLGLAVSSGALSLDESTSLSGSPALAANTEIFGVNGLIFEGSSSDTNETFVAVANPTGDHTFTFPDVATGDVCISGVACVSTSGTAGTFTGNYVANANTSTLTGLTGGSAGSNAASLTLALDESTALSGSPGLAANTEIFGVNGLIFEGSSADSNETFIAVANPTSDHTFTFPDVADGNVCISGIACTATAVAADSVALTTGTTGNYVLSIADAGSSTITVTNGVAEGGAVTLDVVDLHCTNCIGPTEITDLTLGTDTAGNYVQSVTTSALTGLTGGNSAAEGTNSALAFDYSQALSGDVGLAANATVFGTNGLVYEGSSADTNEGFIAFTNPTADHTYTFADVASGNVCISNVACISTSGTAGTFTGNYVASVTTSTLTGLTGGNSAGNATNSALAFDYSQALSGDVGLAANAAVFGQSGLVFEGSAADTNETFFSVTNPTADRTITFSDNSGTVALLSPTTQQTGDLNISGGGTFGGSLVPSTDDAIDLGDNTHRWANLFLGGETLHIGTSTTDEGSLAYTTSSNLLTLANQASSANGGVLVKNAADSTTAFQVQNVAGNNYILVNTSGASLSLGDTGIASTIQIGNTTGAVAQTINLGNNGTGSSTTAINLGSSANTSSVTVASGVTTGSGTSSAVVLSDTSLTSGTGLQITVGNPQTNANGGVLSSASIINVSSANHSYLSLTNNNLTFGGHTNMLNISNINDTYVYDTAADRDGGRWTSDERAQSSSWYNETADHTQSACVVGTDDRCGQTKFPDKAILAVTNSSLYIYNAADNSLWMSFSQNAGATVALGSTTTNTVTSVRALNGAIYISETGTNSLGVIEINFVTDRITKYTTAGAADYAAAISGRNTVQTTAYPGQARSNPSLANNSVNMVMPQVIAGKTFFAAALGTTTPTGIITLVNETAQTAIQFGAASKNYTSVNLTSDDNLYGLNQTDSELDVWYSVSTKTSSVSTAPAACTTTVRDPCKYDETTTPALTNLAAAGPTINTSAPDALFVTNGTSDADGQSNTVYIAHNNGLSVLEEAVGNETASAMKYYSDNMISEEMFGDARAMLPMAGSGTLTTAATITKGTDGDVSVKQTNFTTVSCSTGSHCPTHLSGVRGTALSFDGTANAAFLCSGTAGTCSNNNNLDITTGAFTYSFWVKTASNTTTRVLVNKQTAANVGTTCSGTAGQAGYYTFIDTSHRLNSFICDGTGAHSIQNTGSVTVDDNRWHFVTIVRDTQTTLKQYVDGALDTNGTNASMGSITNTAGYTTLMANANNGANPTTGSMDEFTFTATAVNASQVRFMYNVDSRALNNPNHSGATSIRGTSVAADAGNKLLGSAVKAVYPTLGSGLLYTGTTSGVSVVGIDTDSTVDLYNTSITTKDDVNTNYDATNGNGVVSLALGTGYGSGNIVALGLNNSGSGGVWSEIAPTGLIDFLGNSYNPFGVSLTQSNMTVDRVFRVTNQISTRLDNLAMTTSSMPQIYDILRVDSNGLTVAPGSTIIGTTALKATDISGNSIFDVRSMGTNFGSLISGGAFMSKNAYFGEEYNVGKNSNVTMTGSATAFTCSWARGDNGGAGVAAANAACSATLDLNSGLGEMSIGSNAGAANDQCIPSQPTGANSVLSIERITETATTTAHNAACAEFLTGGTGAPNAGGMGYLFAAGNLPVLEMKVKPSTLPSSNNNQIYVGMYGQGATNDAPAVVPGTGASTGGVYFTNCSATTPTCANTTWYGWVVNASGTLVGSVQCTGTLTTSAFAYLRIEFRTATEVHFYADTDVSNGVNEAECGSGVTSASVPTLAMTPFVEARTSAASITSAIDVDYIRSWWDDNIPLPEDVQSNQPSDTITSTPPLTPDSTTSASDSSSSSNFFSFAAATNEDTIFNKDVYIHGTLYADKVKANEIEGLSIFTDELASLQQKLASGQVSTTSSNPSSQVNSTISTQTATLALNLKDGLTVGGDANFNGNVFFYKLVTFVEKTVFNNDVSFQRHISTSGAAPGTQLESGAGITDPADPTANLATASIDGNDISGQLTVKIGDNAVAGKFITVKFNNPYAKKPNVLLTSANEATANLKYYVTSSTTGFTIYILDPVPLSTTTLLFNYWAVE